MSYKAIFSLAAIHDWELELMNIKTVFFHREINKKVYVEQPTGFAKDNKVCHFNKTFYGLKQSPQAWYIKIISFLNRCSFKATNANHAVFTKDGIIIIIYVDNLLFTGPDIDLINRFKKELD